MSDFNYFDFFNEKYSDYSDFLNRRAIQKSSPKIKVYVLKRENSPKDKVYNEEINRIYLPYFSIRGHYLTQTWTQSLGTNSILEEEQDTTNIVLNMDDMILTMRNLKYLHKSDITIKYTGSNKISLWKNDNIFYIKNNYVISEINLLNHSFKTFKEYLETLIGFNIIEFKDGFENAINMIDFNETEIPTNSSIILFSINSTYENIDNKINIGDLIITHHNVLYEVSVAQVGNLRFFNWPQYILKCTKKNLGDRTQLPDNGLNTIFEDGYLLGKYKNKN